LRVVRCAACSLRRCVALCLCCAGVMPAFPVPLSLEAAYVMKLSFNDVGQAGGGLRVKPVVAEAEDRQAGGGLRVKPVVAFPCWYPAGYVVASTMVRQVEASGSSLWWPDLVDSCV
jgi:hypothetical protein